MDDRSARIFLVKTDSRGRLLWQKEFGEAWTELGLMAWRGEAGAGNDLLWYRLDAVLIKVEA